MWYIFPQIKGLGHSQLASYYAIKDIDEAIAYLKDDELHYNLVAICKVLLECPRNNSNEIFDHIDSLKLRSSMTLFSYAAELIATPQSEKIKGMRKLLPEMTKENQINKVFDQVLDKFYSGEKDHATEKILFFEDIPTEMQSLISHNSKRLFK